jgi:hypothetical protein
MEAPSKLLTRLVVLVLGVLLAAGLWQGYGAWALERVIARGT